MPLMVDRGILARIVLIDLTYIGLGPASVHYLGRYSVDAETIHDVCGNGT